MPGTRKKITFFIILQKLKLLKVTDRQGVVLNLPTWALKKRMRTGN